MNQLQGAEVQGAADNGGFLPSFIQHMSVSCSVDECGGLGGGAGMKDTVFRGSALRNFKVLTEDKEQKQHHQAEGPCRPQLVNKMSGRLQQGVTSKGRKRKWFIESVATELMAV